MLNKKRCWQTHEIIQIKWLGYSFSSKIRPTAFVWLTTIAIAAMLKSKT